MISYFAPFTWIVLLPLGIALHWSLRMVYGIGRRRRDDLLLMAVSIAAWLMIIAGTLGPLLNLSGILSLVMIVAFFVIAAVTVETYQGAQQRALLWALAVAAERDLPLPEAARAFAADRVDEAGRRADRLADLLEAGVELPEALRLSKNRMPLDAALAAHLSHQTGDFTAVLRDTLREGSRYHPVWDSLWQRVAYLLVLVTFAVFLAIYLIVEVVPTYGVIFADYETDIPPITRFVVAASESVVNYWLLFVPLAILPLILIFYGMLYASGWFRWEPPGISWLTRRYHGTMVLRFLAQAVEAGQPFDQTLRLLAEKYPRDHVRARLYRVVARVEEGHDWCGALRRSGLIGGAEAAVLESAQRVGNLSWALREMAESALRRITYRWGWIFHLAIPAVLILIGLGVGIYALAFFYPLVHLMFNLA